MTDIETRIEMAKREAIAAAKKDCEVYGHKWDYEFGNLVMGGGEAIPVGFPDDLSTPKYAKRWSEYRRRCQRCGEEQISHLDGYEWQYDAGMGFFKCDLRTGALSWHDNKTGTDMGCSFSKNGEW